MNIICPSSIQCPGSDSPILNNSSEAPDFFCFWNYVYNPNNCAQRLTCNPNEYYAHDCFGIVCSLLSQADADLQAQLAAVGCINSPIPVPVPEPIPTPTPTPNPDTTCVNEAQTATAYCADGSAVTYTTAAGMFAAPITGSYDACLAAANAQALSYAQQQASALAQLECAGSSCVIRTRSPLPNGFIQTHYSKAIDGAVTGGIEAWTVISGSLPPGLSLTSSGLISGTPTVAGTYQFTVKLLNPTQSIFCTKEFSLTIGGVAPTAYWKMDVATDETDLVDSVGGCNMKADGGNTRGGVPGKFSLGQEFSYARLNTGFLGVTNQNIDYTTGNSLSLWGWFKINGTGPISSGTVGAFLGYFLSGVNQIRLELANTGNPGNVHVMTAANDAYFNVSVGGWHFFHVFFDSVTSKIGYSIDGGTATMLPNVETWPTTAFCSMIMQAGPILANTDVIWDEVGIITTSKLTADQVAFLYNGGVGRTYPF